MTTTTEKDLTCGDCGRRWSVVPNHTRKAHQGYRTEPRTVRHQDEFSGAWTTRQTSRWISEGPSRDLTLTQTATEDLYRWRCACGAILTYTQPRLYWVACTYGHGGQSDTYADRHAVQYACPCCGYAKGHWVQHGGTAPCGTVQEN